MLVLPIVGRELRVQARRQSTYWTRAVASAIAAVLMLWLLLVGTAPIPTAGQGKTLFAILSTLSFIYCLASGALVTADCLSAEKREGTIGLLFLTTLRGYDVVLGKLVSSSLHCIYGVLAVVPMLSMALLFGGVSAAEIVRTALVLANTLCFSLAAGLLVSALSRDDRKAAYGTILLIGVVAGGPYVLASLLEDSPSLRALVAPPEAVLPLSPVFAFGQAQSLFGPFRGGPFYLSLGVTQALAWLFLGLASAVVRQVCQERPSSAREEHWRQWLRRWRLGNPEERLAFRRRLLARNPCFWLTSREKHKGVLVWVLVGAIVAIGFWVCLQYHGVFYEASVALLFPLFLLLKVWLAGETCQRWIEDRQSGALELLLSAPLHTRELAQGQSLALRRQFGGPVLATVVLTLGVWLAIERLWGPSPYTEFGRTTLPVSLAALLADLAALRWVGAWRGLTARGLNRALTDTLIRVLLLRWVLYGCGVGLANTWLWVGLGQLGFLRGPRTWLVFALGLDLYFGWSARRKFFRHLRARAANLPLERAEIQTDDRSTWPTSRPSVLNQPRPYGALRRHWRVALATGIPLLLLALFAGYRGWLSWQVQRRIAAVQRTGAPVTTEEFARRRPELTNSVNTATILERAFPVPAWSYVLAPPMTQNLPGEMPWFSTAPLPAGVLDAIKSFLALHQSALEVLHAAPSLRQGQFALDWRSTGTRWGQSRSYIQYQDAERAGRLFYCEVLLALEAGDLATAADSLHRLLDLAHCLAAEPGPLFQQARRLCFGRAFRALERWLNRRDASETELKAWQQELAEAERGADPQQELIWTRCLLLETQRTPPAGFRAWGGSVGPFLAEQLRQQLQYRLYQFTGAKDRDLRANLDLLDTALRLVRLPWPERYYQVRAATLAAQQTGPGRSPIPRPLLSLQYVFDVVVGPEAEFAARCRVATTALALERYRLRLGRLPERLSDLVPAFLPELPRDPFNGELLHYQRRTEGYCVYSVGPNGQDDGGTERPRPMGGTLRAVDGDITFSVSSR